MYVFYLRLRILPNDLATLAAINALYCCHSVLLLPSLNTNNG